MAALIGGLIGLGMLASSSELVVMQAAGLSRLNIISSVMKTAVLMMLLVMAVGEWGAPVSDRAARELRTKLFQMVACLPHSKVYGPKMATTLSIFAKLTIWAI